MYTVPGGYYKAPVSKVFTGLVVASSLLSISSPALRHQWTLSYQALFSERGLWRLVPCSLAFQSLPELFVGSYLLYSFRLFERHYGSSKYAVFLLFSFLGSCALEALLLLGLGPDLHDSGLEEPPASWGASWLSALALPASGPYGVIFASFVLYALDIPPTARFTLFSQLQFSDKALLYVAGAQLLFSSWAHSLAPGLCGVGVGLLFWANALGIRKAQMPAPVVAAASQYFSFVLSQPPPQPGAGRAPGGGPGAARAPQGAQRLVGAAALAQGGLGGAGAGSGLPTALVPALPPSQEAVDQLLAMGFNREAALRALAQARNDLNAATNILLESQHF